MATLFKSSKIDGLWLISEGPMGMNLGYYKIARPYNRAGESIILDFKRGGLKFSDFTAVGTTTAHLS